MSEQTRNTVKLQAHVTKDIDDWLRRESQDTGRTISDLVRRAIEYYSTAPAKVRRPAGTGQ